MFDFIINLFAEIADFFFTFWADNVIAVSYTHLDVYKRQALYVCGESVCGDGQTDRYGTVRIRSA